jgi:hypothetical protein
VASGTTANNLFGVLVSFADEYSRSDACCATLSQMVILGTTRDECVTCTPAGVRMIYSVAADDVSTRSSALYKVIADPT